MTRFLVFAFVLVVCLSIAAAGVRERRSPQFSQASASATAFGSNRQPGFGGPRPGVGGNFGRGPGFPPGPGSGNFGRGPARGPQFGSGPNRQGQGTTINIAKSVSITTGGGGTSLSQASASSRG